MGQNHYEPEPGDKVWINEGDERDAPVLVRVTEFISGKRDKADQCTHNRIRFKPIGKDDEEGEEDECATLWICGLEPDPDDPKGSKEKQAAFEGFQEGVLDEELGWTMDSELLSRQVAMATKAVATAA